MLAGDLGCCLSSSSPTARLFVDSRFFVEFQKPDCLLVWHNCWAAMYLGVPKQRGHRHI